MRATFTLGGWTVFEVYLFERAEDEEPDDTDGHFVTATQDFPFGFTGTWPPEMQHGLRDAEEEGDY